MKSCFIKSNSITIFKLLQYSTIFYGMQEKRGSMAFVMKNAVICYFARWVLVLFFTILEYIYIIIQVFNTGKSLKV